MVVCVLVYGNVCGSVWWCMVVCMVVFDSVW